MTLSLSLLLLELPFPHCGKGASAKAIEVQAPNSIPVTGYRMGTQPSAFSAAEMGR